MIDFNLLNPKLCQQILVLDTETGGLDVFQNSLLSMAFVSFDGKKQIEIFVKEDHINTVPQAMAVNKIDLNDIQKNGLKPLDACLALEAFLDDLIAYTGQPYFTLVGHNIAFDLAYLKRLYRLAQRPYPRALSHRSIDTHTLLWALAILKQKDPSVTTSDGAFNHYQIQPPAELRHTALGDAVATRDLLFHLLAEFHIVPQKR
jgi:DNA polymerase-3 subunit epsilon